MKKAMAEKSAGCCSPKRVPKAARGCGGAGGTGGRLGGWVEASGKMWSWAWLLKGDRSKPGEVGENIPGREISKCQDSGAREKNEYLWDLKHFSVTGGEC